ncbi:MAG: hypothetical protein JSS72_11415 [Armatimonadetes bacterium]|nr:hypothetical protein [Armatimonadota bacterium]
MESDQGIRKVGYWTGLLASSATAAFVIVQTMQLLRMLPYPLDETLIYATSLAIVIPFILEMLALHYVTPEARRYWTHAALFFTVIYAVFVTANYVVQLATVIPATLQGKAEGIQLLRQTPHSMFWDFDALGYIFMGLAMLVAIPALEKHGAQRRVRMAFWVNAPVTPLITVVYFYPVYSEKLLMLGAVWGITAPLAMLMLALMFRADADK